MSANCSRSNSTTSGESVGVSTCPFPSIFAVSRCPLPFRLCVVATFIVVLTFGLPLVTVDRNRDGNDCRAVLWSQTNPKIPFSYLSSHNSMHDYRMDLTKVFNSESRLVKLPFPFHTTIKSVSFMIRKIYGVPIGGKPFEK